MSEVRSQDGGHHKAVGTGKSLGMAIYNLKRRCMAEYARFARRCGWAGQIGMPRRNKVDLLSNPACRTLPSCAMQARISCLWTAVMCH